ESNVPDNANIDELVENYRKALIIHSYQQKLIEQKLEGEITEKEISDYYEENKKLFMVEQPLAKGLFIKVPLSASGVNKVRSWYKKRTPEIIDKLEKYSLQNAVSYEYFYDKWVPLSEIIDKIPLKGSSPESYLDRNRQVEMKDTAFYYFLNIDDYLGAGQMKPLEFAQGEIKDMLINLKRVEFMRGVKEDLYKEAVDSKEIIYY
ncbi:MAG: peptidyl-prolyl cis-trans isomerase, partial [Bacteroides sp.]